MHCFFLFFSPEVDPCINSPCQQKCESFEGRYECSCNEGYTVSDTDPTQCKGRYWSLEKFFIYFFMWIFMSVLYTRTQEWVITVWSASYDSEMSVQNVQCDYKTVECSTVPVSGTSFMHCFWFVD